MKDIRAVVGVDIAKHVFQLHEVSKETGEITNVQLKRKNFLAHFSNRSACLIGMEACGGAQHWARKLVALGHDVRLLPALQVKAFVCGNKNDMADARAIWMAVQQPGVRTAAIKTEAQQAVLAMHRIRQQLIKFRTAQINALRGLLTEYGEGMPLGRSGIARRLPGIFANLADRLPAVLVDTLREQFARIGRLDEEVVEIERRLRDWYRQDDACRRLAEVPGVGLLTATAVVAAVGDAKTFRSGREFAAWLGLVPRQTGTDGRVKLLGISKRGDTYYLRTLLIHGARSVLTHSKSPSEWIVKLVKRRPINVAIVAMANKTARTLWALLAHGQLYQREHNSSPA
ncbi:IS110 family RNA-guided transposase [Bradyrhizobium liaoningense]